MEGTIFSILLVIIGLFVGIILMIILSYVKGLNASRKATLAIEKAKKEADKIKRGGILEAKEEAHRLKTELEKEIKEKKQEMKES